MLWELIRVQTTLLRGWVAPAFWGRIRRTKIRMAASLAHRKTAISLRPTKKARGRSVVPVQLSGDMLDAFGKVAKELNLSQASAQKVVSAMAPAMTQHYAQMRKEWAAQSEGDPEFGGPAFKANLKSINHTYMDTTTEGLREVLMKTGLNSHPEVLRFFYRLNKERSEGKFIPSAVSSDDRSGSDDFYKGMRP